MTAPILVDVPAEIETPRLLVHERQPDERAGVSQDLASHGGLP